MNKFEVVLLLSPELGLDNLKSEIEKFKAQISANSGVIINNEDWGLRDLSYNIDKFKKSFYHYFQIEISGQKLDPIKKDLIQSENIIRHIFIKVNNHQELPTKLAYEKK